MKELDAHEATAVSCFGDCYQALTAVSQVFKYQK